VVFELCVQFEELLSNQSRIFSYAIPDDIEFSLTNNAGAHILFIMQELFVNFLKHSIASRLDLSIVFDGALRLEIVEYEFGDQQVVVQHSGLKFSGGNGMKNIESRANEIGAVFSVSASGERRISILYFPMLSSDLIKTYQADT
jgi:signal transduction histidine kinase